MDRYDVGEFVGIAGLVWFAALCWAPAAVLVASLGLLVEVSMRSAGRSPVQGVRPVSRLAAVARAGKAAWRASDAA